MAQLAQERGKQLFLLLYNQVEFYFAADRREGTVAELRALCQEKESRLSSAEEQDDLLRIPLADVKMTKIELGGGAYGGMFKLLYMHARIYIVFLLSKHVRHMPDYTYANTVLVST